MKKVYKFMLALLMVAASMAGNESKAQSNYTGFEFSTRCLTASLWATDKRAYDSCTIAKFAVNGTSVTGPQGTYTFPKAGTYTVCLKLIDTCKKWDTSVCRSVTVKSCCDFTGMDFSYSVKCRTVTFEGKSANSGCLKYQFYVVNSGAVVTLSPGRLASYTFSADGSYYVKMTVIDTCNKCDTAIYKTIKIDCNSCNLTPDFTWKSDCLKVKFLASGGSNTSGITYYWSFGDGSSGTGNPAGHAYTKSGVYKVCLTMVWKDSTTGDYCKKQVCKEVKISCGTPCDIKGDFKFATQGGYAKFEAYSNNGYYYEWSFGDGSYGSGKNVTHQYKKPGTYTVCVKIYDKTKKCSVKICKTVVISEPCNIRATFAYLQGSGGQVKFAAISYGGYKYAWDFGDGTTGSGELTSHTYSKPGTYKVCLTVYSKDGKCKITICKTVVVSGSTSRCNWAAKGAGFGYNLVCPKLVLEAKSLDNGSSCIKYTWGITMAGSTHTTYLTGRTQNLWFTANGTYNICLKLMDSCNKCDTVICKTITINCFSKCNFDWVQLYSSVSCRDVALAVSAPSNNSGCYKYYWTVGNGTTSSSTGRYFKHTFQQDGTYKVCLTIKDTCNKCDTTICKEITIKCASKCDWSKAGFDVKVDCRKITAEAYNLSGCYTYTFAFGNGIYYSNGRVFSYQASKDGTYTLCLKIKDTCNNCDTLICKTVTVSCNTSGCNWAARGAGFGYSNKCNDYTFEAKNLNDSCVVYNWYVAGTLVGKSRILNHTFSKTGTYYVCLKLTDTCKKCDTAICGYVKVECTPCRAVAKFTVDSTSKSGVVYLTNNSTGGHYYVWDFGDSTYSYLQNPGKHAYSTGGTRKICLTVYDSLKTCSSTYCTTVQVVKSRSSSTGVSNISQAGTIKIYPNPASDYITIDAGEWNGTYTVQNLEGQVLISGEIKNATTVSTQSWAEGIYLVKTVSNGAQSTTRVVVVRQ